MREGAGYDRPQGSSLLMKTEIGSRSFGFELFDHKGRKGHKEDPGHEGTPVFRYHGLCVLCVLCGL